MPRPRNPRLAWATRQSPMSGRRHQHELRRKLLEAAGRLGVQAGPANGVDSNQTMAMEEKEERPILGILEQTMRIEAFRVCRSHDSCLGRLNTGRGPSALAAGRAQRGQAPPQAHVTSTGRRVGPRTAARVAGTEAGCGHIQCARRRKRTAGGGSDSASAAPPAAHACTRRGCHSAHSSSGTAAKATRPTRPPSADPGRRGRGRSCQLRIRPLSHFFVLLASFTTKPRQQQ